MPYAAVLDADVLHPYNAVDLLLRLAERRLFRPVWSQQILGELEQSLVDRGLEPDRVGRRISAMVDAFAEAMVVLDVADYLASVPAEIDEGDKHVVAAALAGRADGIVTNNVQHFPAHAVVRLGLDVQSLDEFLFNQLTLDEEIVLGVLREIEADRSKPPRTSDELLDALTGIAPRFVEQMRTLL